LVYIADNAQCLKKGLKWRTSGRRWKESEGGERSWKEVEGQEVEGGGRVGRKWKEVEGKELAGGKGTSRDVALLKAT
jgi:hypothetical protein